MNIRDIQRANKQSGHFFFEPESLRFFDSRIGRKVYEGPGGVYFTTSERFKPLEGTPLARRYTVRQFDPSTSQVSTVGKFQDYPDAHGATFEAARLAAAYAAGPDGGTYEA
jgi:hypothetical protein